MFASSKDLFKQRYFPFESWFLPLVHIIFVFFFFFALSLLSLSSVVFSRLSFCYRLANIPKWNLIRWHKYRFLSIWMMSAYTTSTKCIKWRVITLKWIFQAKFHIANLKSFILISFRLNVALFVMHSIIWTDEWPEFHAFNKWWTRRENKRIYSLLCLFVLKTGKQQNKKQNKINK